MTISGLKNEAKRRISSKVGTLAGATLVYMGIYVGLFIAIFFVYSKSLLAKGVFNSIESMQAYLIQTTESYSYSLIVDGISILIKAVMAVFAAGIQFMCLSVIRGNEIKVSDVFYSVKRNPDKVILLIIIKALLSFLFAIPVNVMAIMSDSINGGAIFGLLYNVFNILSLACDIALTILMSQCIYLYIDNPQDSIVSYIEKSIALMKTNAGKYILLVLSFIPLQILAVITLGVMYIWVLPYQYATYAIFYMKINGEQGNTIDVTIQ